MTKKFQNKYRIESNRWQNWDYSAPGNYFITICIQDREEILGKIINGEMQLSAYGEIVKNEFIKMAQYHQRATLDEWVIMPNHVHCIITLGEYGNIDGNDGALDSAGDGNGDAIGDGNVEKIHEFSLQKPTAPTENDIKQYRRLRRKMLIPVITGKFQQQTSKQINILRNTAGQKTWQPNYHDHVIRDEPEYLRIKQYIISNPAKWNEDTFNDQK